MAQAAGGDGRRERISEALAALAGELSSRIGADLARQVSRETESAMRNLVRDEMIRQQRPGGMGRR